MSRFNFIYDHIRKHGCKRIMEIGVHQAERSVAMLQAAGPGAHFVGFDLFQFMTSELKAKEVSRPQDPLTAEQAANAIRPYAESYFLVPGDTKRTLGPFVESGPVKPEVIFIDGGHSFETAYSDLLWCVRLMDFETVIFVDDYSDESKDIMTRKSVETVMRAMPGVLELEVLDCGDRASEAYGCVDLKLAKIKRKRTGESR